MLGTKLKDAFTIMMLAAVTALPARSDRTRGSLKPSGPTTGPIFPPTKPAPAVEEVFDPANAISFTIDAPSSDKCVSWAEFVMVPGNSAAWAKKIPVDKKATMNRLVRDYWEAVARMTPSTMFGTPEGRRRIEDGVQNTYSYFLAMALAETGVEWRIESYGIQKGKLECPVPATPPSQGITP